MDSFAGIFLRFRFYSQKFIYIVLICLHASKVCINHMKINISPRFKLLFVLLSVSRINIKRVSGPLANIFGTLIIING